MYAAGTLSHSILQFRLSSMWFSLSLYWCYKRKYPGSCSIEPTIRPYSKSNLNLQYDTPTTATRTSVALFENQSFECLEKTAASVSAGTV